MSAIERVGAFLLEMAERTREDGAVALSMSRYDIGDYLGLAAETVGRTLSDLRQAGAIRFEGTHRVRIIDCTALQETDNRRPEWRMHRSPPKAQPPEDWWQLQATATQCRLGRVNGEAGRAHWGQA